MLSPFSQLWRPNCISEAGRVQMNVKPPSKQTVLEPRKRSPEILEFEERLRGKIIGQDEAVGQLVNVYQTVLAE
jgi:hypothetical protein